MALNVVTQLAAKGCRGDDRPLQSYSEVLQAQLEPSVVGWEKEFGPIVASSDVKPGGKSG